MKQLPKEPLDYNSIDSPLVETSGYLVSGNTEVLVLQL